jgi:hypothetical protein
MRVESSTGAERLEATGNGSATSVTEGGCVP